MDRRSATGPPLVSHTAAGQSATARARAAVSSREGERKQAPPSRASGAPPRAALLRRPGQVEGHAIPPSKKFQRAVRRVIHVNRLIRLSRSAARRTAYSIPLSKTGSLFDLLAAETSTSTIQTSSSSRSLNPFRKGHVEDSEEEQRFKMAARFVIDALEGRSVDVHRRATESVPRLLKSKWYRWPLLFVALVHMSLVMLEPTPANNPNPKDVYWQVVWGELVIMCIYFADIALNLYAFGKHHFQDKKWDAAFAAAAVICFIDWFICYPLGVLALFRVSRALRPVFLISKKKTLRRLTAVMLRTFPKMVDLAGVFFTLLVVYAVLGAQMFNDQHVPAGPYGYQSNNDNYNNVGHAALATYIFTTTENYPSVMYPALMYRPVPSCVYFFSGIFFFLWLLVPLWLAIVYDHYREVRAEQVISERVKEKKCLLVAYHVLHDDGGQLMDYDRFAKFVSYLPATATKGKMLHKRFMFQALDSSRNGTISVREFLQLKRVMSLKVKRVKAPEPADSQVSCFRRFCRNLLRHSAFWWITGLAVFGTTATALLWTLPSQYEFDNCFVNGGLADCSGLYLSRVEQVTLALLLVGVLEMVVKVTARSWRFFDNLWNCFDFAVVIYCTVSTLVLLLGVRYSVSWWILELFQLSRALRSCRMISVVPRFRAVIGTLLSIMRITLRISVVYTGITYAFAIVGMYILADVPGDGNLTEQLEEGQIYSMRTFLAAMFCLLQLTVGNNWNSIVYPNVVPTNRAYSLFFCLYFVVCTTVLMNIVTGVIIEAYCLSEAKKKKGMVRPDDKDGDVMAGLEDGPKEGLQEPLIPRSNSTVSGDGIRLGQIFEEGSPTIRRGDTSTSLASGSDIDVDDAQWQVRTGVDWQQELSAEDVGEDFSEEELKALAHALDQLEEQLVERQAQSLFASLGRL